jgi:hypothetical protein
MLSPQRRAGGWAPSRTQWRAPVIETAKGPQGVRKPHRKANLSSPPRFSLTGSVGGRSPAGLSSPTAVQARESQLATVAGRAGGTPLPTYARTRWHTRGIGTAKRPQRGRKRLRKANLNLTPRFVRCPSTAGNMREYPRKRSGSQSSVLACSRLFPALGTAKGPQERRCGPFVGGLRTAAGFPSDDRRRRTELAQRLVDRGL